MRRAGGESFLRFACCGLGAENESRGRGREGAEFVCPNGLIAEEPDEPTHVEAQLRCGPAHFLIPIAPWARRPAPCALTTDRFFQISNQSHKATK